MSMSIRVRVSGGVKVGVLLEGGLVLGLGQG